MHFRGLHKPSQPNTASIIISTIVTVWLAFNHIVLVRVSDNGINSNLNAYYVRANYSDR